MLKRPGFTLVAVLTLALGIGANTAIFSIADKLLIQTLPVREPQQLALVHSVSVNPYFVGNIFSYPDYADYRDQNQVFAGLSVFATNMLDLRIGDRTERAHGETVSGDYFDTLGVNPALGRAFAPEENRTPGTHPVAVISDGLWRRLGADPQIIGKELVINDVTFNVIGVAPREFTGLLLERGADIWIPIMMQPRLWPQSKTLTERNSYSLRMIGRIKEGVSMAQAQAGLDSLAQRIKQIHNPLPANVPRLPFSEQRMQLEPGGKGVSFLRSQYSKPLRLLLAIVSLVLLIACANVANLLLTQAQARRKEIAVRLAVGANRWQIIRQMLTESLLLAGAGGIAALILAPWITDLLLHFQPTIDSTRTSLGQTIDFRVFAFTVFVSLVTGLIFGLLPALQASRPDLLSALKDEVKAGEGGRKRLATKVDPMTALRFE
jgi:predicted permease